MAKRQSKECVKVNVFDVAHYILSKIKAKKITTWKLQKLIYYSQAWSLVWDDKTLFCENIEAWANGPVCRDLYDIHKGKFKISYSDFAELKPTADKSKLSEEEIETIDAVLHHYQDKTAQYLSELTHAEAPWITAREGLSPGERGKSIISHESMAEYYGGL